MSVFLVRKIARRGQRLRLRFTPRCCRGLASLIFVLAATTYVGWAQELAQDGGDFSTNTAAKKLPTDVILVQGALASASDATTPLPEGGVFAGAYYTNKYFRLAYALPQGWTQKYSGPPPSDSGYYVLGQFIQGEGYKGSSKGSILIAAQDLFFTLTPATNALELINASQATLAPDYKVEQAATPVSLGGHSFVRFDYFSPAAQLHWRVLATQIRCHALKFVLMSGDTQLLDSLLDGLNNIDLPPDASPISGNGEGAPVCIQDYARGDNILEKVDPVFTERKFNAIPVRIIIGKEGKVKHIHFLSAFPDQAKSITDALW